MTNSSESMEQTRFGKDLLDAKGNVLCDNQLYGIARNQNSILHDMYIIKNTIVKNLKCLDLQTAINVKI